MPANPPPPPLTDLFGQPALPRDVELPGDPLPLRRWLALQRRQRTMREGGQRLDDPGDDP